MYLKSIVLQGFKSFTEKTLIQLENGISCIVGPNGSGKSNIADAVRWVLGEQSAKTLRGQKMEDVIFSGSGKRKPVGMAEVVLNIDNSDGALAIEFTEVSVCRRAYRSGESEYQINGKQCRLKDLQELFLDSGISNNSLAMVGQGRVQEIVSMKPEERRSLIEEAAGVIKYRNRKKTAVRKLGDTERNLERIWDIISELAERLEPLQEQAAKAEKFLELKASADSQEINLLLQVLAENKTKLDAIRQEAATRQDQLLQEETEKATLEAKTEELQQLLQQAEEQLNQVQQQLFEAKTQKEREESNTVLLAEKQKTAQANVQRLDGEIELLLNRDDGFMLQVEKLEAEKNQQQAAYEELENQRVEQEQAFSQQKILTEELKAQQELARDEIFDRASQLAHSKNELVYEAQAIADNEQQITNMSKNLADLAADRLDFDKQIAILQQATVTATQAVAEQKNKIGEFEGQAASLSQQLGALAQQEVASRMQLNSQQSRLKVLTELHDNLDGYYPGVRALLKAKKQKQPVGDRIIGVVVELIEADKQYSVALEAALAASLQHLVVQDDQAAKAAVAYLKKEQLGRATFLPLGSLAGKIKKSLDQALGKIGVIGRASDIVRCQPEIRPVVEFLLANILLVENLDVATKIARENGQQFKIITLDGDVISPGGAITGGSRQRTSGDLLQKKAQLFELQQNVAQLTRQNREQLAQMEALKQQESGFSSQRAALQEELRRLEIQQITQNKDLDHLQATKVEKEKHVHLLALDLEALKLEQQRLQTRHAELEREVANWQSLSEQANQALAELQEQLARETQVLEQQRLTLEATRIAAVKKDQEYQALHTEVERLRSEKSGLFQQEAEKRRVLQQWQSQIAELAAQLQASNAQDKALAAKILQAETAFAQNSQQVAADKGELDGLTARTRELARSIGVAQQELHQLELKETRLQTEWDSESLKLAETFALSYDEALGYLDTNISRRELSRNVKEQRRQIAELGNVNLDSIEEYREVKERHEFLSSQREDLLAARASLNKVIKEMDAIMMKRFQAAFDQVNQEFNKTFAKLFGGGSAGLAMTAPEDILETGVDMVVQPPGKKLVNYNLLSGGEKSLIGIALILAIFQVKPSPFCVLDEVDAALDEANVDRFAEYLQDFAKDTQFIVVSHRQGTMEAAASLWGVTMEEDGVSKVVSVKLSEAV